MASYDVEYWSNICQALLIGSLSVMSVKALGIAIKLTVQGNNQLMNVETWMCVVVVLMCVMIQMNYLNKALDIFNTAVVTPIYYVMFTTLTLTVGIHGWCSPRHRMPLHSISQDSQCA
jgi:hypothetical protein